MNNIITQAIDTPWKAWYELLMYLIKPFVYLYLYILGVRIGKGFKFYGFPRVYRHRGSRIIIGDNFECRSWKFSNPLGLNHSAVLCTWSKDAIINIGNDVGLSGATIVAAERVEIGSGTIVGANSTIIDTDFHPIKSQRRRYDRNNVKTKPVVIGGNVFIGMGAIILKGTSIKNDTIVPAGAVIR